MTNTSVYKPCRSCGNGGAVENCFVCNGTGIDVEHEFDSLNKFYDVTNNNDLIRKQAKHIERLQAKVPKVPNQFQRTPREG